MPKKRKAAEIKEEYVKKAKDKPCADCGKEYPFYVMQFDHIMGDKKFNVSEYKRHSLKSIIKEIKKCAVVCANCHARRTYIARRLSPYLTCSIPESS